MYKFNILLIRHQLDSTFFGEKYYGLVLFTWWYVSLSQEKNANFLHHVESFKYISQTHKYVVVILFNDVLSTIQIFFFLHLSFPSTRKRCFRAPKRN